MPWDRAKIISAFSTYTDEYAFLLAKLDVILRQTQALPGCREADIANADERKWRLKSHITALSKQVNTIGNDLKDLLLNVRALQVLAEKLAERGLMESLKKFQTDKTGNELIVRIAKEFCTAWTAGSDGEDDVFSGTLTTLRMQYEGTLKFANERCAAILKGSAPFG